MVGPVDHRKERGCSCVRYGHFIHIRRSLESPKRFGHLELIQYFSERYPRTKNGMLSCLCFSLEALKRDIDGLTKFQVNVPLSQSRAEFVVDLIEHRRARLLEILNG